MNGELERIKDRLRNPPPACVRGFRLTPAELPEYWDDNCKSVWQLACTCGEEQGAILGYSLKDYNPDYAGPEVFISPLAFECVSCGKITEIIDTDRHGYHSQVAKLEGGVGSVQYRGQGPRARFACPACGVTRFSVTVGFVYWRGAFDL